MKKLLFILAVVVIVSTTQATTLFPIWEDDMTSLDDWGEGSDAWPEEGDSVGGIRIVNYGAPMYDFTQMNSWWDSAVSTAIWQDTGIVIQDETHYYITYNLISFASSTPVDIGVNAIDGGWTLIQEEEVEPSTSVWEDHTVFFTTMGSNNTSYIGDNIGVGISGGDWNNFGVSKVTVVAVSNVITFDTTDAGETKTLDYWGADQTWVYEDNMTSTIEHLGSDIDAMRLQFNASEELDYDGDDPVLTTALKALVDEAME